MEELLERGRRPLVLAIGGGGDVASAAVLAKSLERLGFKPVLASIAWERYVVDPVPGPIRLEELRSFIKLRDGYALVDESAYAERGGRRVKFQAANASGVLKEPIYVVDLYGGVRGYVEAIEEVMADSGADFVIGIDVGGDSLATGCEDNLWSPLADWVGVSALGLLKGVLAVHSPGSDGELSQGEVLARIDYLASKQGLLAVASMTKKDAELLELLLSAVRSEASRVPLLAFKGYRGPLQLRFGSRSIVVSFINTLTFYLEASLAAESSPLVKVLASTRSLEEARRILNSHGIYTELDLEEDLASLGVSPEALTGDVLLEVRSKGAGRLAHLKEVRCKSGAA